MTGPTPGTPAAVALALTAALALSACSPGSPPATDEGSPTADAESGPVTAGAPPAAAPGPDIYLAPLERSGDSLLVGEPVNLTDRPGYDNQPAFLPDGSGFLYTVIDTAGRADIWRFHLAERTSRPVTRTPESEYSPTPLPDGSGFSAVRVEADSTQRLWRFDMDGGSPRPVLEEVAPVGYHAWIDGSTLALFVLGDPATLQGADVGSGQAFEVARDIGRSIQPVPDAAAASFVQHDPAGAWIGVWTPSAADPGGTVSRLAPVAAPGADDHAWAPGAVVLQSDGPRIFAWTPAHGPVPTDGPPSGRWTRAADLTAMGLTVTRMAVHPDGRSILLVGETGGG